MYQALAMSAAQSGGNMANSAMSTALNYEANKRLSEQEFQRNVDMWMMQNQYNLPSNQMKRLEDAGLNPHLVYGTGTVTGNTIGNAPQYRRPEIDFRPPPINVLSESQDYRVKNAQIANLEANEQFVSSKTVTEGIQQALKQLEIQIGNVKKEGYGVDNQQKALNYKIASNLEQSQYDLMDLQMKKVQEETNKYIEDMARSRSERAKMYLEGVNLKWDSHLKKATLYGKNLENRDFERYGKLSGTPGNLVRFSDKMYQQRDSTRKGRFINGKWFNFY